MTKRAVVATPALGAAEVDLIQVALDPLQAGHLIHQFVDQKVKYSIPPTSYAKTTGRESTIPRTLAIDESFHDRHPSHPSHPYLFQ